MELISDTIKATGRLHRRGVTMSNRRASPGPAELTSSSNPKAPPLTVKYMIPIKGMREIFFNKSLF
jgi:hypothetical protein